MKSSLEKVSCIIENETLSMCCLLTAGLFPVGCYLYPFMYQLPHNIPGLFSFPTSLSPSLPPSVPLSLPRSLPLSLSPSLSLPLSLPLCPLPPSLSLGSFSAQHEEMDSNKSWEGVVQYSVTAVLQVSAATNNRLSVSILTYNLLSFQVLSPSLPPSLPPSPSL